MNFTETKEYSESESFSNLLLVDSLNLAFRYLFSKEAVFAEKYVSTVKSFAKSYECDKVIITGDWGSQFRRNISPEYKQNRRDKVAEQTPEEEEKFQSFLKEYNRALDLLKLEFPVVKQKGVEADDIIAYISLRHKFKDCHTWIISSDGDLDQLLGDNVSRFAFTSRKEFTKENWHTHHDYPLDKHIDIKCLMGDSGDNVPGIKGVGPKRAEALVAKYGSIYDILGSMPLTDKGAYIAAVNEFEDKILTNVELMDLTEYCEEALLNKENITEINNILEKLK